MTTTEPEGALTAEDHRQNAKACEEMAEECRKRLDSSTEYYYIHLKRIHEGMAKQLEDPPGNPMECDMR